MAKNMAKNSQQGKRTSWIHDMKEADMAAKDSSSCLEEIDWWPHSPRENKRKMTMRQLHLSTDQVITRKKSSTCYKLPAKNKTIWVSHLFFMWFWCESFSWMGTWRHHLTMISLLYQWKSKQRNYFLQLHSYTFKLLLKLHNIPNELNWSTELQCDYSNWAT